MVHFPVGSMSRSGLMGCVCRVRCPATCLPRALYIGLVPPCHCAFCVVLLGVVCLGAAGVGRSCVAFVCLCV